MRNSIQVKRPIYCKHLKDHRKNLNNIVYSVTYSESWDYERWKIIDNVKDKLNSAEPILNGPIKFIPKRLKTYEILIRESICDLVIFVYFA